MTDLLENIMPLIVGILTFAGGWFAKYVKDKAEKPEKDIWDAIHKVTKRIEFTEKKAEDLENRKQDRGGQ